jgi:tetratricopeptide (TPR) repeat protein
VGQTEKAVASLREAVALEPASASYWNSLGMVLGARGEMEEAGRAFQMALEREATNAQYAYNRGLAYQKQGRTEEAAALFRKALSLDPRFVAARRRLAEIGPS